MSTATPSRAQWVALCWIRRGNAEGRPTGTAGSSHTNRSLERRAWARWIQRQGWVLTRNGLEAVATGDRKYGPSQPTHSPELLAFVASWEPKGKGTP